MAENVTFGSGNNSTPPDAEVIAADDISGVKYQRVKIALGADGAYDMDTDSGQQTMANSVPVAIASNQSDLPVQPFDAILEGGLTELIGINEQVDQNEYCASVGVALGGTYSGEILSVCLYSTEDGTGAVQTPEGWLYLLDADPATSAGDTSITAAERVTVTGRWKIETTDWETDANGGTAYIFDTPVPFHALSTLYFVFKLLSATSINSAAGDDEQIEFSFWYRRDS